MARFFFFPSIFQAPAISRQEITNSSTGIAIGSKGNANIIRVEVLSFAHSKIELFLEI
jgi:hypothetical protein